MDDNKTALVESLIIWVSVFFPLRECVALEKETMEAISLPVCRWWGLGCKRKHGSPAETKLGKYEPEQVFVSQANSSR